MAVELPNNWWQRLRKQPAFWVVSGILLFFLAGFVMLMLLGGIAGTITGGGGEISMTPYLWVAGILSAIAAAMFFYGFYLHFTRQK